MNLDQPLRHYLSPQGKIFPLLPSETAPVGAETFDTKEDAERALLKREVAENLNLFD